jgi:hypothetical protein
MKKLAVCTLLVLCGLVTSVSAKSASYSASRRLSRNSVSLNILPYNNLLDVSKWSKLTNGHALTLTLRKKRGHASPPQDFGDDELFGIGAGGSGGGGGCGWGCCFKQCLSSALDSQLCILGCGACYVDGSTLGCATCLACGTVALAAVEFCSLHCCVNPGC